MTQFEQQHLTRIFKASCDPVAPPDGRYSYALEDAVSILKECGMVNNNRATAERLWKRITTTADYGWHAQRTMQSAVDELQRRTGFTGGQLQTAARTAIDGGRLFARFVDSMTALSSNRKQI